jgi:hypothetical protein
LAGGAEGSEMIAKDANPIIVQKLIERISHDEKQAMKSMMGAYDQGWADAIKAVKGMMKNGFGVNLNANSGG